MKRKPDLIKLLKKAALSARRKASKNNLPIAISENGQVKLIYPDNSEKVIHQSPKRKKAS